MKLVEGENARYCLTCNRLLSFENFGKCKRGKYGLRSKCVDCRSTYAKEKRKRNDLKHKTKLNIIKFRDLLFQKRECGNCGEYKDFKKFSKQEDGKYGRSSWCKKCVRENSQKYYSENRESVLKNQKQYQKDNPEKVKAAKQKWKEKNPEFYSNYFQENKDKFKVYRDKYYKNNKKKIFEAKRKRVNKRYKNDLEYRLTRILRTRLHKAVVLEYKSGSAVDLLGCSIPEFKQHLENQFEEGMTWDNYSYHGWHIDHIRPCASFDLTDSEQQAKCFHYTNLQPLWKEDNLKKGDTYDE